MNDTPETYEEARGALKAIFGAIIVCAVFWIAIFFILMKLGAIYDIL